MSLPSFLLILTGVLLNAVAQLALKASVRELQFYRSKVFLQP